MISYPPAMRRGGVVAPRAVGRMGLALMEARAAGTARPTPSPAPPQQAVIPMAAPAPHAGPHKRTVVCIWLPSTLIFLLLAPFALLLAPLLYFAPPFRGARPFAMVIGLGRLLLSLGGTVVDVDTPDALVSVRLF